MDRFSASTVASQHSAESPRIDSGGPADPLLASRPPRSNSRLDNLLASLSEFQQSDGNSVPSQAVRAARGGRSSPSSSKPTSPNASLGAAPRARSVGRMHYGRSADDVVSQMSLSNLQASQATLSAFLFKLASNHEKPPAAQDWKLRFFVLSRDSNLHLFKSNAAPFSLPITYLPLTGCSPVTYDASEMAWVMDVFGNGMNEFGVVVRRHWTLKFPDEATVVQWSDTINRLMQDPNSLKPLLTHVPSVVSSAITSESASNRSASIEYSRRGSDAAALSPNVFAESNLRVPNRLSDENLRMQQAMRQDYVVHQREAAVQFRQRKALQDMEKERQLQKSKLVEFSIINKTSQEKKELAKEKAEKLSNALFL
ncbi:hypothetical protein HDU83_005832 [Entophlyctis luteolus]|nr:hypothetical protein HDU83_005832 [Entophlyctis luteolus]KAJ3382587.1 hypothetical protein HDU84_004195 [Entophlyctis sp. JEL0112]